MYQGFYNLTSGMLTQNRNLNVVSNNIANAVTPGYKKDTMVSSTFQEEMFSRTGNIDKSSPQELNERAMLRSALENVTDFSQGHLEETGHPLDFALTSAGFFQLQTETGIVYSRNGSFSVDDQGYLVLPEGGRVLGQNGPILVGEDQITADGNGGIYTGEGRFIDRLAVVNFEDTTQLNKAGSSTFTATGQPIAVDASILHQTLERSNVDATGEMIAMMQSQRALQSAAQVLKMYDQLMAKASTEIGRI